jgi:hypothetical protein
MGHGGKSATLELAMLCVLTWRQTRFFFFLKRSQNLWLNLLIKKERIAQLIYGKPGKNRYKQTPHNANNSTPAHLANPGSKQQPQAEHIKRQRAAT